jgi:putative transposase
MQLPDGTIRHLRRSKNHPRHAHELTFSCVGSLPLLNRDPVKQFVIDALDRARARHNFSLWAYVIMPNHVHLLLMPRAAEYRISVILKAIKQPVAFRALECCRARKLEAATSGPRARQGWQGQPEVALGRQTIERRFWQPGGGYDCDIISLRALHSAIDYIHLNPVRAELVKNPTDWEWSSARWYAGEAEVKLKMDPGAGG